MALNLQAGYSFCIWATTHLPKCKQPLTSNMVSCNLGWITPMYIGEPCEKTWYLVGGLQIHIPPFRQVIFYLRPFKWRPNLLLNNFYIIFWNPYFFIHILFLQINKELCSPVILKISKPETLKTCNNDTKVPKYLEILYPKNYKP